MKFVFLAVLLISAFAAEYPTEDGVVVLSDSNFDEALKEFEFALVEFYAPWCGHCKKLTPEYAAAAQELARTNPEIKLVKIDATIEKQLASRFEIKGFPTLKLFAKGAAPILYEGQRTKNDIVSWLKKKAGPTSVELKSVDSAEQIISNNEVAVVYFGDADSEGYKNYLTTALALDDVAFAHTHDDGVRQKYEVQGETIILFKKFDEGKNVFTGPFQFQEIKDFLNANRFPVVFPFDSKNAQRIFAGGLNAIILIRSDNEAGAKAEEELRSVSREIRDSIAISVAKIEDTMGGRLADYIGIDKNTLPAIRIIVPKKNAQKFIFEKEITGENIKTFVEDWKNDKLSPYYKSAEIPAESHEDNVRVLVGKNFKEIVLGDDADVLVEYYAPWCGHCKSLAPIYAAVATKLKDVKEIVIAKMDATANEVEGLAVSGFPTIKFYQRGRKNSPMDYSGDRTEDGFIDFLKKNSKAQFSSSEDNKQDPSGGDL